MKGNITPMIRNRRILVTALAAVLVLLTSIPGRSDSGGIPNENAKGYWTQDRMANAIPIELVVDQKTGIGTVQPAAGRKSGGTIVTPTSEIFQTSSFYSVNDRAQRAYGKVFFSVGRSDYVCSGAVVSEDKVDRMIVLTAGHCVWDQTTKRFVTNWMFRPNFSEKKDSADKWYASALVVRDEFASQTKFNTTALLHDWAFAVFFTSAKQSLNPANFPDPADSYPLSISGFAADGSKSVAFGYPQAAPWTGESLVVAGATIFTDPNTKGTWGMSSTMTGGASGGPWLSNSNGKNVVDFVNSGSFSSLNSYKYTSDTTKMYGPKFIQKTLDTFSSALTATGDQRVKL